MSTNRQIAKNIIYNIISFGIGLIISFFFTPYLIRVVGKEAYGFYPLVENILGYSQILTAAVGSMAGRFVTMSFYKGDKEACASYFNSVLVSYLFFSALFTVLGIIFVFFIDKVLNIPDGLVLEVQILFLFAVLNLSTRLATTNLGLGTYVKNRIELNSSRSVSVALTRVALILLLFWLFKPSIVYMSISALGATLLGCYFDISFKRKLLPEIPINLRKYYSWSKLKEIVSSGIWLSLNNLSMVLVITLDLLLTNIFISASSTADLSIAKTVPSLLGSLGGMIATTFTPNFNILYAKDQHEELLHEIKKSMIILSLLLCVPLGFLLINADWFFKLWVPTAYSDILYWLSFVSLMPMVSGLFTNSLAGIFTITNNRKVPAISLFITGIVNISLLFILLKTTNLGVMAIVLSSAITMSLRNIFFTPIYGAMCLNLKKTVFFPALLKGFLSVGIVAAVTLFFRNLIVPQSWMALFVNALAVSIVSLCINYFVILTRDERHYLLNMITSRLKRK